MSIDVEHLSFSYGSHHVLRDLSFRIPDNTLVNVLGPNGVGKSTLFRCILCLNNGWTGSIRVTGKDLRSISIRERASEVAYIPQSHSSTYAYDVLDVVLMSAGGGIGLFSTPKRMHVDRAWDALERVGIAHLGHRPYTQISGGERQLVLIARAIAQAKPGDSILIAGKGHEDYQLVGDQVLSFDDRIVAAEELACAFGDEPSGEDR